MKRLLLPLILMPFINVFAQIKHKEGVPKSFSFHNIINSEVVALDHPRQIESKNSEVRKDVPQVFALPIDVDFNLNNSGFWTEVNGESIWILNLKSENAKNLNFHFSNFQLPEGAEFFIYSKDRKEVRGPFTSENNRLDKSFAVYLLKGDEAVLELNVPSNQKDEVQIQLERVFHGDKDPDDFGDSGACNNNINCPEGADWQIEKKAVGLILSGGINGLTWCSGSMVNNVREDGLPYFLTANHCLTGTENNWAFVFNYESPDCSNTDGTYNQSVLGAQVLASDEPSDFALLLLDETPPTNYGVYHAGWDANDIVKDSVVGIHHPQGDIKKISFDYDSVESSGYFGAGDDHWQVLDWDDGTTEPTSSGSALFDKEHRIIGQLHGGSAACGNNLEDYYGKFSYSWDEGATASTRLKDWLDPDNTGATMLNGNDFNVSLYNLDLGLLTFNNLKDHCDTIVEDLEINIKNLGSDTVFSTVIDVFVDGDSVQQISWNGVLTFASVATIQIDTLYMSDSIHEIKLVIKETNGILDENLVNDTITKNISTTNGYSLFVDVTTDSWGNETSVQVFKDTTVLYELSGYGDNVTTTDELCLTEECYTLVLNDDYGDGISSGGLTLYYNGFQFATIDGDLFTYSDTLNFCLYNGNIVSGSFRVDLSPTDFLYDESILCGEQLDSIGFVVYNHGFDTVTNFSTVLKDNNVPIDTTIWNEVIVPGGYLELYINKIIAAGAHNLKISTISNLDSNNINDTYISNITITNGVNSSLNFYSNGFANSIEYYIERNDTLVYYNSNYSFNDSVAETLCLEDGCFKLIFKNTSLSIVNPSYFDFYIDDSLVASYDEEIGDSVVLDICINDHEITQNSGWYVPLSLNENLFDQVSIYPNPTESNFKIVSSSEVLTVEILSVLGELVYSVHDFNSNEIINVSSLSKGIYYVRVDTINGFSVKKIIKK